MGAQQRPFGVDVLFGQLPEQVRIAHCREHVVGFHAVVPVVGAKLQKLRQVLVPGVQIHGHSALAHAQLVYRYGGVVHQADPPHHTSGRALKAAYAPPAARTFPKYMPMPPPYLLTCAKLSMLR